MKFKFFLFLAIMFSVSVFALDLPPGVIKLGEYQQELALSITILIAFIGGLLTFTSPCGFVVMPTFFAYVFKEKKRAMFMTSLFVAGMTLAFIIFGLIAGFVGDFFNIYKEFFGTLSGIVLIVFGFLLAFNIGFSIVHFRMDRPKSSIDTFLLGFFFAVGWSPCVGPILGGVLLLAANTANALKGALLFGSYSLGVALPLLLVSYLSDKYDFSKWFTSRAISFSLFGKKVYTHLYGVIGGVILALIGLVMLLGSGTRVFMTEIPKLVPWTMSFFTMMNERLVMPGFFTSIFSNIIGGLIIIAIIIWVAVQIRKAYKENKK